jgi:endonuclease/exonuclease/phosphatase family metal-dependent hydrolase
MRPDIVVLTETSKAVDLGADYVGMFTEPSPRKPQEHKKAIEWQGEDWQRLRTQNPSHHFIATGDFNQTRGNTRGYGNRESRDLLSKALARADLQCVTEADFRATHGLSRTNIDHVCLSASLLPRLESVDAWEGTVDGVELSDHNGVTVLVRDN